MKTITFIPPTSDPPETLKSRAEAIMNKPTLSDSDRAELARLNTLANKLTKPSPDEVREVIKDILMTGEPVSEDECELALTGTSWEEVQPILDKAQGVVMDISEEREKLRVVRVKFPLHRSDFTESELEKLKRLAPEEYELMK